MNSKDLALVTGASFGIGEALSRELVKRGYHQNYAKFTTNPAPMPDVIVSAWEQIWRMSSTDLGGKRRYETDFEIYDERASDDQNIILDLYIGIK